MKRLFVGCRVRILWSHCWPELAGTEGRIIAKGDGTSATYGEVPRDWWVHPDAWPASTPSPRSSVSGKIHRGFAPCSDQLEPILPDGATASTMSFQSLMESLQNETQLETP